MVSAHATPTREQQYLFSVLFCAHVGSGGDGMLHVFSFVNGRSPNKHQTGTLAFAGSCMHSNLSLPFQISPSPPPPITPLARPGSCRAGSFPLAPSREGSSRGERNLWNPALPPLAAPSARKPRWLGHSPSPAQQVTADSRFYLGPTRSGSLSTEPHPRGGFK